MTLSFFFFFATMFVGACACETVLTHAEIAADRARAVEFFGAVPSAMLGYTVSSAGDVNGDGFGDVAIAAPREGDNAGAVYLVFGRSAAAWASAQFDFNATDTPDAESWIKISAHKSGMYLGWYGLAAGDFNGDGLGDLLLSTSGFSGNAFCVYGRSGAWRSFNTSEIGSGDVPGLSTTGYSDSICVGAAGDMNGDGIEDMLFSVYDGYYPSVVVVVFGEHGANRGAFDLSAVNGTNGFSLMDGTTYFGYASAICSAGDINGDGLEDLAIGSYTAIANYAGRVYVLFAQNVSATGGKQWPMSFNLTAELDGTNGFFVDGAANGQIGKTVTGVGDVNGDGFDDLLFGSSVDSEGSWLLFGASWIPHVNVSHLDGANGFHFASGSYEYWGCSNGGGLNGAGDINGDGFDDIIVGGYSAANSAGIETGAAAIIFGHPGSWPAEISRNDVAGSVGFLIDGPDLDSYFGFSVRGSGDVNGDGLADVVVGAYGVSSFAGYAALVFGTPDDHCAVCSNTTDACLYCDDGFTLNGARCEAGAAISSSHSVPAQDSVVVIINFNENIGNTTELQEEIASVLGIDAGLVSVVVISPTEVEVTIIGSEEIAQRLVDIINNGGSGSGLGLLRKATDAHIRKDSGAVVVIETSVDCSATEVETEVVQLLAVDATQIDVVEITPRLFEVGVTSIEVAQHLVVLIEQCMEQA